MKDDGMIEGEWTVVDVPPVVKGQRRSYWSGLFAECRACPGEWRRTMRPLGAATAAQVASDLRNAAHRDPAKMRVRGLLAGERWEAVWAPDPAGDDPARCFIWLRCLGIPTVVSVESVESAW